MLAKETLTRGKIARAIHVKVGLSRAESLKLVEQILALMSESLATGEDVRVARFGTFLLRDKVERIGRNPRTGVEAAIPPRRVVTFRASRNLKNRIVRGTSGQIPASI